MYQKELCPEDSICDGGQQVFACRPFSKSAAWASSEEQCLYAAGYYSLNTTGNCNKCPPASFCTGGTSVKQCPGNVSSSAGAAAVQDFFCINGHWRRCTRTRAGVFLNNTGHQCNIVWTTLCVLCGANDICYNDTLLHCPENSVSEPGSSLPEHCECLAGYAEEHL